MTNSTASREPTEAARCSGRGHVARRGSRAEGRGISRCERAAVRGSLALEKGRSLCSLPSAALHRLIERRVAPPVERRRLGAELVYEAPHRSKGAVGGSNVQGRTLVVITLVRVWGWELGLGLRVGINPWRPAHRVHAVDLRQRAKLVDVASRGGRVEPLALALAMQQR
eukprot:scaffold21306_cov58-Phaeocystis_antarctica.AAC.4